MIGRALDSNNDIFLNRRSIAQVSDGAQVVQNVRSRLLFYLGECAWDTTRGVAYFTRIFVKPMNLAETEAILKTTIIQTAGVSRLIDFRMSFNSTTRQLAVVWEAESVYGIISGAALNQFKGVSI